MAGKESVTKLANNEEKKKALDAAIAKLEKDFGKGAVMRLGESGAHVAVETVPTGCLSLDLALGLGGVPKGRVIEVYGPESMNSIFHSLTVEIRPLRLQRQWYVQGRLILLSLTL